MNRKINAWWMISNNFGDALNYYLLSKLFGQVTYTPLEVEEKKIVAIGSILNWCNETSFAWGCGFASEDDSVCPRTTILATRGPLTREIAMRFVGKLRPNYGDPALLLPIIYRKELPKKYKIGVIAHYIDQLAISKINIDDSILIINVFESIENFVDQINECDFIISSSLHGLIVANAYNIPSAWVKFTDNIGGDNMKYIDFYLSVDIDDIHEPIFLDSLSDADVIIKRCSNFFTKAPKINPWPLIDSSPYPFIFNIHRLDNYY